MVPEGVEKLGFDNRLLNELDSEELTRYEIARVTAVHRDGFAVNNGRGDVPAEVSGKMLFSAESPFEYPATGDWVLATFHDEDTLSIIHRVLSRKSLLKRKTAGKKIDFQPIAANIDFAFIVQSLDTGFNLNRLERYLVMVADGNVKPVVLLSKSDLLEPGQIEARVSEINELMPGIPVQPFSSKNGSGLYAIKNLMSSRQTHCLLGSSGVGKTTLLNNLVGESSFKTHAVRGKDGKGRHTTSSRQLILLADGAIMIDTPGMRELGNFAVKSGLEQTFADIAEFSERCRFNDCSHVHEKGCAVLKAIDEGRLSVKRYQNYIKMNKESVFNEMSYVEKRKKEKQFGKMCKSVMNLKKMKQ